MNGFLVMHWAGRLLFVRLLRAFPVLRDEFMGWNGGKL